MRDLLAKAVMTNMSTRITMKIVNNFCVRRMAESISLSQDQAEGMPKLKPRQAVMHYTGYPYSSFLMHVPELDLNDMVSDHALPDYLAALRLRIRLLLDSLSLKPLNTLIKTPLHNEFSASTWQIQTNQLNCDAKIGTTMFNGSYYN
jgi:hypothetical protein